MKIGIAVFAAGLLTISQRALVHPAMLKIFPLIQSMFTSDFHLVAVPTS
jgi:hypothetical protein